MTIVTGCTPLTVTDLLDLTLHARIEQVNKFISVSALISSNKGKFGCPIMYTADRPA